jgi:hypothetical protein
MTPQEKAEDIVRKYSTYVVMWTGGVETERQNVKQCALIAVDEILSLFISECEDTKYWQQVKQEIEKL